MALLKNPLLSEDARGRFAGTTVYTGGNGQKIAKAYAVPSNPRTTAQNDGRAAVAALSKAWGSLTSDQIALWREFGKSNPGRDSFGKHSVPGLGAFIRSNYYRQLTSVLPVDEPPTVGFAGDARTPIGLWIGGGPYWTITWSGPSAWGLSDQVILHKAGPFTNEHRRPRACEWRRIGFASASTGTVNIGDTGPLGWYWLGVQFWQWVGYVGNIVGTSGEKTS